MDKVESNFYKNFKKNWWVACFILFSFLLYQHAVSNKNKEIFNHKQKLYSLNEQKNFLLKENEDLNLMVNSLSDPAWIEMILIRDLGVVPEGKLKVHFTTKE